MKFKCKCIMCEVDEEMVKFISGFAYKPNKQTMTDKIIEKACVNLIEHVVETKAASIKFTLKGVKIKGKNTGEWEVKIVKKYNGDSGVVVA